MNPIRRDPWLLSMALFFLLAPGAPLRAVDAPKNKAIIPVAREGGFMDFHRQYVAQIKQGNIDVIFTGDSITFKWRDTGKAVWDKYYGGMKAVNFGHSGDGTQHLLWRLQNGECDGPPPKVVVLMIGTNNMGRNTYSVDEVTAGVAANVNELRRHWPATKILLLGITPSGGSVPAGRKKLDAVNLNLAKLDDGQRVFFLDIGPKFMDAQGAVSPNLILGPHPTAAGYALWAAAIQDPLRNLLAGKRADGAPLPESAASSAPATAILPNVSGVVSGLSGT